MSRFEATSCSQCGRDLGPGDAGVSHCDEHGELLDCLVAGAALTFKRTYELENMLAEARRTLETASDALPLIGLVRAGIDTTLGRIDAVLGEAA